MKVESTITNNYTTSPTGRPINEIFIDILNQIQNTTDTQSGTTYTGSDGAVLTVFVVEYDSTIFVELKNKAGEQNTGYNIELEVSHKGQKFDGESLEKVYSEIEKIIKRNINIRE